MAVIAIGFTAVATTLFGIGTAYASQCLLPDWHGYGSGRECGDAVAFCQAKLGCLATTATCGMVLGTPYYDCTAPAQQ